MIERYSQGDVDDILGRLDPAIVLGEYLNLKSTGRAMKALCPFHQEKTPSFSVNPENGLWHCFGCGKGGNLLQFVMAIEHCSFTQTLELLAKKAGISLIRSNVKREAETAREEIRKLLTRVCDTFHYLLVSTSTGAKAMQYLLERGISRETISKFKLGFASDSGNVIVQLLESHKIPFDLGVKAGLIGIKKDGHGYYDYFRNRVIVPISDFQGRIIAFGGRTLDPNQPAKYINSPETSLFKKGFNLFALHLAKRGIEQHGEAVVVEGYFDAILPHQVGTSNVVASLGTALTQDQLKLLRRYSSQVVLLFDPDNAGICATDRVLPIAEQLELTVKIGALPKGKDPDLIVREEGKEGFQKYIDKAQPLLGYQLMRALNTHPYQTPEGKARVVNDYIPWLRRCNDIVVREEYLKKLSEALHIPEALVRSYFVPGGKTASPKQVFSLPRHGKSAKAWERQILKLMLQYPETAAQVFASVTSLDFQDLQIREIVAISFEVWQEKAKLFIEDICGKVPDGPIRKLITELALEDLESGDLTVMMPALLKRMQEESFKDRLRELKSQMGKLLEAGKVDRSDEVFQEYNELIQYFKKSR